MGNKSQYVLLNLAVVEWNLLNELRGYTILGGFNPYPIALEPIFSTSLCTHILTCLCYLQSPL